MNNSIQFVNKIDRKCTIDFWENKINETVSFPFKERKLWVNRTLIEISFCVSLCLYPAFGDFLIVFFFALFLYSIIFVVVPLGMYIWCSAWISSEAIKVMINYISIASIALKSIDRFARYVSIDWMLFRSFSLIFMILLFSARQHTSNLFLVYVLDPLFWWRAVAHARIYLALNTQNHHNKVKNNNKNTKIHRAD